MQAGGRCCDKGPAGTSRHRRDGAPASRDPEFPVSPQIPLRTGLHTVQLIRITRHTQSSRTLSPWHKRKWTLRCGQLAAGGANETLKLEMAAEGNMRVRTAHRSLAPTAAVHNVGGAGAPPAQDRWGLGGQGCREAPVCTEGQDVSTAASSQRTKTGTLKGPNRFPPGTLRRGSPRRRDPQKTMQPQEPMGSVKKKKKKRRETFVPFSSSARAHGLPPLQVTGSINTLARASSSRSMGTGVGGSYLHPWPAPASQSGPWQREHHPLLAYWVAQGTRSGSQLGLAETLSLSLSAMARPASPLLRGSASLPKPVHQSASHVTVPEGLPGKPPLKGEQALWKTALFLHTVIFSEVGKGANFYKICKLKYS